MINYGIIGYGFMGHHHGEVIQKLTNAKLIGVFDIKEEQLKDAPLGVKIYKTEQDFFNDEEIDTIIISVPNQLHLEMVKKATKARKNIICEKPAAMSVAEFDEMITLTKEANVLFTIHHQRRWDQDYQVVKKVLANKEIGEEYLITSSLYGFNGNMHDWHVYKEYGGGMLYDWGVHLIDQLLDLVKADVVSVYADIKTIINDEVDDYFTITLKFSNGITGRIELGTYMLSTKENWFEHHWFVAGNKGSVTVDGFSPKGSIVKTSELLENVPGKITMTAAGPTRSFGPPPVGRLVVNDLPKVSVNHEMFFENYESAYMNKEKLAVKPDEIRLVLKVVEAARKSSKTNSVILF